MARKFREIGSRLTGVSTPIFGVSWNPPTSDVAVANRVISFLEDRRVLYWPSEAEIPDHCVASVIEIRHFLTKVLGDGGIAREAAEHLKAMRYACRRFMRAVAPDDTSDDERLWTPHVVHGNYGYQNWLFNQALGELRATFGLHIAVLAAKYGIDVEEDLASILPLGDEGD